MYLCFTCKLITMYNKIAVCRIFSSTSNRQCSLFSKKNPIIRIFCISGWLAVQINPDKWSSTVKYTRTVLKFTCAVYTVSCVLIQLIRDVPEVSFVSSTTQSTVTLRVFSPSLLVLLNPLAHSLGFYCCTFVTLMFTDPCIAI